MEKLPAEMLDAIFIHLPESDRLSVSFTCRRWFNLLKNTLPGISTVCICLDASACSTDLLKASTSEAAVTICLCSRHAQRHAVMLRLLFQTVCKRLQTLAIEDLLIPKGNVETRMPDTTFHVVLNSAPECLRALHFQGVDFSDVRPWTFALLVKLRSLEELHILDAILPFDNESIFARIISPSYDTLTSVSITNNEQITDKFASTLARRCPVLQTVNLSGCKRITALTVLTFAENAPYRIAELTFINVHATTFSFDLLKRCLSSPLLVGGNNWKAKPLKLEIGFQHDAVCLENIRLTNLFIVVFV